MNGAIFYFVARLVCFPSRYDRDQTGGRSGSFIAKKREINPKGDEERGGGGDGEGITVYLLLAGHSGRTRGIVNAISGPKYYEG